MKFKTYTVDQVSDRGGGMTSGGMYFPETETDGATRITPEQIIRGDVCRYLEVSDDGTIHTGPHAAPSPRRTLGIRWNHTS